MVEETAYVNMPDLFNYNYLNLAGYLLGDIMVAR